MTGLVLLSAGGTGGHLFPAEALGHALRARGLRVVLATDARVGYISAEFPADEAVTIPSATPSGRSLLQRARAALVLGQGFLAASRIIRRLRPAVVVGFGGYPTVPPVMAASFLGVPTLIHEQNGVMGRANRLLARRATRIATGFPEVRSVPDAAKAPRIHTGNPVRPAVIEAAARPYAETLPGGPLNLLVFGGSQGARVMSEVVPAGIGLLSPEQRGRLRLTQQARGEDLLIVRKAYEHLGLSVEAEPFFKDLPRRIADAHLVVSRSGASTVAELAAIGRPSILVPLPGALDQDQAANAASLEAIGAATVIRQPDFTPERLAQDLAARLDAPQSLTAAARAAKSAGRPDAAERLADAALDLARL